MSPTALTLRKLREDGWPLVQVVEVWNPHARIRQDLFSIIDVLAVGHYGTLAIQATSASNAASRFHKLVNSDALPVLHDAGWVLAVWGFKKIGRRWELTYNRPVFPGIELAS
jgi:hypothetical protein